MISNQIAKFQNAKKLIEFLDKLNPAEPRAYAHLHAGQEELAEGEKRSRYSLVCVGISDYSQGAGKGKTKYASFNLSPCEIKQISVNISREIDKVFLRGAFAYGYRQNAYLISIACIFSAWLEEHMRRLFGYLNATFSFPSPDGKEKGDLAYAENSNMNRKAGEKLAVNPYGQAKEVVVYTADKLIAAAKDENGKSPMSRIVIKRCAKDNSGEVRRSPWQIAIDNGRACAEPTSTGGFKAKSGSYVSENYLFVWLTDDEVEKLFRQVCDYISVYEHMVCYASIREGRARLAEERNARQGGGRQ